MTEAPFRISGQDYVPEMPIDKLREHPDNPNQGDVGAISESLDEHGFVGAIIVQKSTGAILAGNHRYRAASMKGAKTIPAFVLDVDDDEAKRILLVDNRTARLATFDEEALVGLLSGLADTSRGLAGTGYSGDDLDDLMAQLGTPFISDDPGSDGDYNESPEEMEKRSGAVSGYRDRKEGGALVEMILVYSVPDRQRVSELLDAMREHAGNPDARAADLVLASLESTVESYNRVEASGDGHEDSD